MILIPQKMGDPVRVFVQFLIADFRVFKNYSHIIRSLFSLFLKHIRDCPMRRIVCRGVVEFVKHLIPL